MQFIPDPGAVAKEQNGEKTDDQRGKKQTQTRVEEHVDEHGRGIDRRLQVNHLGVHQAMPMKGHVARRVEHEDQWLVVGHRFNRWDVEESEDEQQGEPEQTISEFR